MQQRVDFDEGANSVLVLPGLQDQSGLLSVQTVRSEVQEVQQEHGVRTPHVVPRGNQQGTFLITLTICSRQATAKYCIEKFRV